MAQCAASSRHGARETDDARPVRGEHLTRGSCSPTLFPPRWSGRADQVREPKVLAAHVMAFQPAVSRAIASAIPRELATSTARWPSSFKARRNARRRGVPKMRRPPHPSLVERSGRNGLGIPEPAQFVRRHGVERCPELLVEGVLIDLRQTLRASVRVGLIHGHEELHGPGRLRRALEVRQSCRLECNVGAKDCARDCAQTRSDRGLPAPNANQDSKRKRA